VSEPRRRPEWLREGLIFAGEWEPLIYRRRNGNATTTAAQEFERAHSREAVERLADLGVNLVITHYHKGFGPAAEQDEYGLLRQLIGCCHEKGIRVGAYMRLDTLAPETLLLERPEAKDWFQVNWNGQYPVYNDNDQWLYFRRQGCVCNEDYLKWIEERIRFAVVELKVDLLHFDGVMPFLEGYQCYCDRCLSDFRQYLQRKYTDPELAKERFGFADLSQIMAPTYAVHPSHRHSPKDYRYLKDPVMQEWVRYRCEKLAAVHRRLSRFIQQLNPEVAMEVNTLIPLTHNAYFWSGLDLALIAPENDCMWTEDEHWPRLTQEGVLVSRIREFKIGRTLKNIIFSYQRGSTPAELKLSLGQAMAFNAQTIGMVGGLPVDEGEWRSSADGPGQPASRRAWPTPYQVKRQYIRFFRDHFEHYADTESAGGVALLRSRDALSYSMTTPHHHALLWEQVLIQSGIPFDIIFDEQLADLAKYQALVLPCVDCMSQEMIEAVSGYVTAGGGLVASGDTSSRDQWRRLRPDLGLREVLGPKASRDGDPHHATRNSYGKGRAAHLARLLTEDDISDWPGLGCSQWKLPLNVRAMREALRWAARDRFPITLEAPETVVAEFLRQPTEARYLVHLLNFDLSRYRHDLAIVLRLSRGTRVRSAIALDPDRPTPEKLEVDRNGEVTSIAVPTLGIYQLVVVSTQASRR
jgi:hypothetical protein